MIFGIGTDLVQIERIEATYRRYGERFVNHLLLPEELLLFDPGRRPARFLAMRFAAKEAIAKALGTGFRHGVWVRDFGFSANDWGRPEVLFSARGRALADRLGAGVGHVSLTDEAGLVMAVAILMKKA